MTSPVKKGVTVLTGIAAIAESVKVELNEDHEEVERVQVLGVPLFQRDDAGRPRVLGVRFPRWIRGPRT